VALKEDSKNSPHIISRGATTFSKLGDEQPEAPRGKVWGGEGIWGGGITPPHNFFVNI